MSSGSAYVFEDSGSGFAQTQKLTASDAAAGDRFGVSVAVSGSTIVVGACEDDDGGSSSGSAYVFEDSGSGFVETQKLTASDAAAGDRFGKSVAVSGSTIVVGAYEDDDGGPRVRRTFLKTAVSGFVETQKLTASDAAADDWFGESVAVSGSTIVVGALRDDDGGSSSGSAYIYDGSGGVFVETQKLGASDAAANDRFRQFGGGVGLDHRGRGANRDDDAGTRSGSAYVFEDSGSGFVETKKLTASDAAAEDLVRRVGGGVGLGDRGWGE